MSTEVIPSQSFLYQQWVQGLSDSYEAFRLLADTPLRVSLLALESAQSLLRTAIDENVAGKLFSQQLREAIVVAVQLSADGSANDATAVSHASL